MVVILLAAVYSEHAAEHPIDFGDHSGYFQTKYRLHRAVLSRHMETHTQTSACTHTTDKTQFPTVKPERLITWSLLKVLN